MAEALAVARSELLLGGQKSGKSRRAEALAASWLSASTGRHAVLVATGQAWDEEMRARIQRHREDRARRVPTMQTVEAPLELPAAIAQVSRPDTLVVADCLTMWLTSVLMPAPGVPSPSEPESWLESQTAALCRLLVSPPGPIVLVSNEIGLGVIPMGREVRHFVDELGRLNQAVAAACERVTLMAAGLPLALKGRA
jgi:adenosylcobinamide kinase/adenosylcobinamide-phosphate guanylyltransferase